MSSKTLNKMIESAAAAKLEWEIIANDKDKLTKRNKTRGEALSMASYFEKAQQYLVDRYELAHPGEYKWATKNQPVPTSISCATNAELHKKINSTRSTSHYKKLAQQELSRRTK